MSKPKKDEKCKKCQTPLTYLQTMMGWGCAPCNRLFYPDELLENENSQPDDVL